MSHDLRSLGLFLLALGLAGCARDLNNRVGGIECVSNLKSLDTALQMYRTDNGGHFPDRLNKISPKYLRSIPTCPSAHLESYSALYRRVRDKSGKESYQTACQGDNHGLGPDLPGYSSDQGLIERRDP